MTFSQAAKDFKVQIFEKLFFEYLNNKRLPDLFIDIIRQRLFNKGLFKDGKLVRDDNARSGNVYPDWVIRKKKRQKLPDNRVTLFDNGYLYRSMRAQINTLKFSLIAEFDNRSIYTPPIYSSFMKTFSSEREFDAFVMSLTDEEIHEIMFLDFLKYLMKK